MIASLAYLILVIITWYFVFCSLRIVRATKSLVLIVPLLAIYFWSLFGVWTWIPLKLQGEFLYYEDELFPMPIDMTYLLMISYYSLFSFVFLTILSRSVCLCPNNECEICKSALFNYIKNLNGSLRYFCLIILCFSFFVYFARQDILTAALTGKTAYEVGRFDSSAGNLYGAFQYAGDLFMYLSIPLLLPINQSNSHYFKKTILILLIIVFYITNLFLGNRNILVVSMAVYFLLYSEMYGLKKLFSFRNIVFGLFLLLAIESVYFLRMLSVDEISSGEAEFSFLDLIDGLTGSSEKYFAQMSMYGVLSKDVSLTYGSSILFLLGAMIPKIILPDRPMDIYDYYIESVLGQQGIVQKGFTIHHATGWYLNFGIIGILIGALMWASILSALYKRKSSFLTLYASILFSSVSIQMIRSGGLECYKASLIMSTLIPILLMKLSLVKIKWNKDR